MRIIVESAQFQVRHLNALLQISKELTILIFLLLTDLDAVFNGLY